LIDKSSIFIHAVIPFATADLITLYNILAVFFGINCKASKASCAFFHFTNLAIKDNFLSEVKAYFKVAATVLLMIK
jgi:hypothetical protein